MTKDEGADAGGFWMPRWMAVALGAVALSGGGTGVYTAAVAPQNYEERLAQVDLKLDSLDDKLGELVTASARSEVLFLESMKDLDQVRKDVRDLDRRLDRVERLVERE